MFESWLRVSGFVYRRDISGGVQTSVIQHDMGRRWSTYFEKLIEYVFEDLNERKPSFDISDNLLSFFLLSKKSMHGQELAEEIARRKGEKPSPGTIYLALKSLKAMGFIVAADEKEGKTIVYTLTDRGKHALQKAKRRFIRTFLGVFP
jgi:PadR family transcriptional regulator